jgi:hypothetical protein
MRSVTVEFYKELPSLGIATGYGIDSRQGQEMFLYSIVSRLGPTHPIQWVLGALSLWVKWPGREVNHSPPSNAEVKNGGDILHSPICLHGVVLS